MELTQKIIDDSYEVKDLNAYKPNLPNNTNRWKSYMQEILKKIPSSEKQKESSYLAFNNSINDFLGKMRIVQRSLNEKSEGLNSDLDDLEREAGFVLDRYNNFVD
jgi:lysyl-tRNA synthetase class I